MAKSKKQILENVEGRVWVESIYKKNRDETVESKNEPVKVCTRQLPEGVQTGYVKVGLGQTINLGNYESLRVDVGCSLPALPEEMQQAYEEALDICKTWLMDNVLEIQEARDSEDEEDE